MILQTDIPGPAGRLEALYEEPEGAPLRFVALVCHPHPGYGGTMHNHATYRIAKAVRALGGASLRFNYRGVGRSAGTFDEGLGEKQDTLAALSWLRDRRPELPLHACGFSFGSWMVLSACCGEAAFPVRGLLAAGLPLRKYDLALARRCPRPIAAIQAAQDEFGSPEEIRVLFQGAEAPRWLAVVAGATHLFTEQLTSFQREAQSGLSWLLETA